MNFASNWERLEANCPYWMPNEGATQPELCRLLRPWAERTQLICNQTPDPQKLWDTEGICFKQLNLPTKVRLVKAMVFPVVMYGCESWTVKKTECWIDAFELWCWRRLLRVPWTAKRSNQSIPKEISPGCSLEGLMLKLKLQYFGYSCEELSHWIRFWCWEGLEAGGEGDNRGWDGWMASPTWCTWV